MFNSFNYPCLSLCILVYPMSIHVYLCLSLSILVCPCLSMSILVYPWLSLSILVNSCIALSILDYPCLSLTILVYPCVSLSLLVYPCLSLSILVYPISKNVFPREESASSGLSNVFFLSLWMFLQCLCNTCLQTLHIGSFLHYQGWLRVTFCIWRKDSFLLFHTFYHLFFLSFLDENMFFLKKGQLLSVH